METTNKTNEICEDKEHKGVFSMKLNYNNFIEYMGGEFTMWSMENGDLKNPQKITSEKLEQMKNFVTRLTMLQSQDKKVEELKNQLQEIADKEKR